MGFSVTHVLGGDVAGENHAAVRPHKAGANQDSRDKEENDKSRLRDDVDGRVLFFSVLPAEVEEGRRQLLDHKQKVVGCAAPVWGRGINNRCRAIFRLLFTFDRRMAGTRLGVPTSKECQGIFGCLIDYRKMSGSHKMGEITVEFGFKGVVVATCRGAQK